MAKEEGEKRILFITDIHAPYHDHDALHRAVDFAHTKDIDEVIVSELPDLYGISSWLRDPLAEPFYEELEKAKAIGTWIGNEFAACDITYLVGNHEERINTYTATMMPEMAGMEALSIPNQLGINELHWNYVDNKVALQEGRECLQRGKLTILHGHEIKMPWGAINLAKILYERARCNVIAGHHHRKQEWQIRKLNGKYEGCWMVGCLCDLHPEYRPHNDWVHGFAIIHLYENGHFSVENRQIIEGKIL